MIDEFGDINLDEYIEDPPEIKYRLQYLFMSLILLIPVLFLLYKAMNEVLNLQGLFQGKIYISVIYCAIPFVLIIPFPLIWSYAAMLRFFQRLTHRKAGYIVVIGIPLSICAFVLSVPYKFGMDIFIRNMGYSYCYEFSAHVRGGDTVYVRDPAYCLENSNLVRSEIMEWVDTQVAQGKDPTVEQVHSARRRILKAFIREHPYYRGPDLVY